MSFFEKMKLARENKDHLAFGELLSENYTFVRHQTGTTMNKEETLAMIQGVFNSDAFNVESHRCVYENDDILVEHLQEQDKGFDALSKKGQQDYLKLHPKSKKAVTAKDKEKKLWKGFYS